MNIPFRELPGKSRLFIDYIDEFDRVAQFFQCDYRSQSRFSECFEKAVARDLPIDSLVPMLKEQNQAYGCGAATMASIDVLATKRSGVIVTGQQTGLFGGPLFTVYKALTAIKLAEWLRQESGHEFIPVFWLASEDHDFREVNHCSIIEKQNTLLQITYDGHPGESILPVSDILLSDAIKASLQALSDGTHTSEFKPEIMDALATAYLPGTSFSNAFARWLMYLLKQFGIVFIDGSDHRTKALSSGLFAHEISEMSPSSGAVISASEKLAQLGYHNQVSLKQGKLNLFFVDKGRFALQSDSSGYRVRELGRKFTQDELLNIVGQRPGSFSPNVILRPLYQDMLLPTVAYVAGPAELSYYAQMKDVYGTFELPMPIIYPRKSMTLLESKVDKVLQKHDLQVGHLFGDVEALINKLTREQLPSGLYAHLAASVEAINRNLQALEAEVGAVDSSLTDFVRNARGRIVNQIEAIEKKILQAAKKQDDVMRQQLYKAHRAVYPGNSMQERSLNIVPYLFKYGPDFIAQLYDAIDLGNFDHQVINV